MNGDEVCAGGFVHRALIGMVEVKNQAAVRADKIVAFQVGVMQQPLAQQRIAGGFTGDQHAEQFGQLRKARRFGALDVGHEALADLQFIETGGNEFLDRHGHGELLSRGNGRLVSKYIMRRIGGLGAVSFELTRVLGHRPARSKL